MTTQTVLAKGLCERIGIEGGRNIHKVGAAEYTENIEMATHADAIRVLTARLTAPKVGLLKSMKEIDAVGHRVLHGGQKFTESVLINDDVEAAIEECIPLGPLHNPPTLWAYAPAARSWATYRRSRCLTPPSTRPCPKAYLYAIPLSTTASTPYAATASTAPPTATFREGGRAAWQKAGGNKGYNLPFGQRLVDSRRRLRQMHRHLHGPYTP